jgi:hypothetical protein
LILLLDKEGSCCLDLLMSCLLFFFGMVR